MSRHRWPLGIALEKGFHSLVEVLLQNGVPADRKALQAAVNLSNEDFVKLLIQYGADPMSLDTSAVVYNGSPKLIRLFIEYGADLVSGYPLAAALVRAPRPLLGIYKAYIAKYPEIQFQLDIALRIAREKQNLRTVSMLMWGGGNPRAVVPLKWNEDRDFWKSPLEEASRHNNLEIIKRLKPSREKDDINVLLRNSPGHANLDIVRYWLSLGGDVNSVEEDGATIHGWVITRYRWEFDLFTFNSESVTLRMTQFVLGWFSLGAKWQPTKEDRRELRRCLGLMPASAAWRLIETFSKYEVIKGQVLAEILDTPPLRNSLRDYHGKIAKRIPCLTKWALSKKPGSPVRTPSYRPSSSGNPFKRHWSQRMKTTPN